MRGSFEMMMRKVFIGVGAALAVMSASVTADAAGCSLVSSSLQGVIQSVGGDVMRSASRGFASAASGDVLTPGAELITGADGTASIVFDGKTLEVSPNSTVRITKMDGNGLCVRVARAAAGGGTSSGGGAAGGVLGGNGMAVGVGVLALGGIGAGVAIASSGHGASD